MEIPFDYPYIRLTVHSLHFLEKIMDKIKLSLHHFTTFNRKSGNEKDTFCVFIVISTEIFAKNFHLCDCRLRAIHCNAGRPMDYCPTGGKSECMTAGGKYRLTLHSLYIVALSACRSRQNKVSKNYSC